MFIILRLTWSISHPSCLFDWYRLIGAKRDLRKRDIREMDERIDESRSSAHPAEAKPIRSTMRVVRSRRQTVVKSRKSREMTESGVASLPLRSLLTPASISRNRYDCPTDTIHQPLAHRTRKDVQSPFERRPSILSPPSRREDLASPGRRSTFLTSFPSCPDKSSELVVLSTSSFNNYVSFPSKHSVQIRSEAD